MNREGEEGEEGVEEGKEGRREGRKVRGREHLCIYEHLYECKVDRQNAQNVIKLLGTIPTGK